jgi:predicted Zn-dependent protease
MRTAGRSPLRAALALALAALVAWTAGGCATNPVTGRQQLSFFSSSEEIEIGQESDRQVAAELGLYADPRLEARVAEVGRRLAAGSERPELPWTFRVVDDPTVNAFAVPGGYVFVTRGLLGHLGSEAQLAGVLGHEIGHVTARHGIHEMSRQLLTLGVLGLGVEMLPEKDQELAGALLAAGTGLLFLKYSRDDERQADDLGLRYMAAAGWSPPEMPAVFTLLERVGKQEGGALPGWLSTHPPPDRRRERMNAELAAMRWDPATARVGAGEYLDLLDGLAFGDDPRRGYLRDGAFFHPGWKVQLSVPAGWRVETTAAGASLVNGDDNGLLLLETAE